MNRTLNEFFEFIDGYISLTHSSDGNGFRNIILDYLDDKISLQSYQENWQKLYTHALLIVSDFKTIQKVIKRLRVVRNKKII